MMHIMQVVLQIFQQIKIANKRYQNKQFLSIKLCLSIIVNFEIFLDRHNLFLKITKNVSLIIYGHHEILRERLARECTLSLLYLADRQEKSQ